MQLMDGFNVRVYGILIVNDQVLLSEEDHAGSLLTKFPGGGIEKGESPAEALVREFQEEAQCQVEIDEFFYVSPNFHRSYFRPMQLIALYWRVRLAHGQVPPQAHVQPQPLASAGHFYRLRWQSLDSLSASSFTTPLDREVVEKLLREI